MAINEVLTARVREALYEVNKVEEKKMFRGITFMVDGKMCISVGDDELMLRVDPTLHEKLVKEKGCRSVIMKGREYKGYVYVQQENVQTRKSLDDWLKLALEYNHKAKASKKK